GKQKDNSPNSLLRNNEPGGGTATYGVVGSRGFERLDASRPFRSRAVSSPLGEKGARCSPADSNRDLRRFKGRASAVGLGEQAGATGPIRTDTARGLKPLPPTNWATVALVRAAGVEPALFTTSR